MAKHNSAVDALVLYRQQSKAAGTWNPAIWKKAYRSLYRNYGRNRLNRMLIQAELRLQSQAKT